MLNKIKSAFFLKMLLGYIPKKTYLKLFCYNKELQKILQISKDTYIRYSNQIEIEIIPQEILNDDEKNNTFVNLKEDKSLYHIYLYGEGKIREIDRTFIKKDEKVSKIKVLIDMEVKSIDGLFERCEIIKEIKFIKFNRTDFSNMSAMFYECENLIKLDIDKIKTNNIQGISYMFARCISLKSLNLENFDTSNVTNMEFFLMECSSLKKIDLSKFKTDNVIYMKFMFADCSSLEELDLSNFRTDKVYDMACMLSGCTSLKKLQ